jgi:hypothetical protein
MLGDRDHGVTGARGSAHPPTVVDGVELPLPLPVGSGDRFAGENPREDRNELRVVAIVSRRMTGRVQVLALDPTPRETAPRLSEQLREELALRSAVPFTKRMREVHVVVEIGDFGGEVIVGDSTEEVRIRYPLSRMGYGAADLRRRHEGLATISRKSDGAKFTCPFVDVLEELAMQCLHVAEVVGPFHERRIGAEFGEAILDEVVLGGLELFRVDDPERVSENP